MTTSGVVTAVVTLLAASHLVDQNRTFAGRTDVVSVSVGVRGRDGSALRDLRREDFAVEDEGTSREVVVFAAETRPIGVAILLDGSGSYGSGGRARDAVRVVISNLLPADRASVSTLDRSVVPLTANHSDLYRVLERNAIERDNGSPVWSAIEREIKALSASNARSAVLMFTDGWDTVSYGPFPRSLTDLAQRSDVALYAVDAESGISTGSVTAWHEMKSRGGEYLRNLARLTGGREIDASRAATVVAEFTAFIEELRHQYVLGFQPGRFDDKFHDLKVKVARPGATVTARARYLAARVR